MMTREDYLDIYSVVGVGMEVYNNLGRGMAEPIYQEAFAWELSLQGMSADREKPLHLFYKGKMLEKVYYADFFYKGIVIELKAVEAILPEHRAQLYNYMRMARQRMGVLFNFGERSLRAERYLYDEENDNFVLLTKNNYRHYILDEEEHVAE